MSLKIGFGASNKNKKPLQSSKALFGDDEEDEPTQQDNTEQVGGLPLDQLQPSKRLDDAELPGKPSLKAKSKPGLHTLQYGDLSAQRSSLKTVESALQVDAAIYDYDAAFDAIHAKDAERKAQRRKEAEERQSRYIENFMAAAETRKQDLARARDKQLQREREAEGDMYADKEKFVTEAYKKQQEQLRKAEEDEKKKQEEEEKKRKALGMQGFYKAVMDEQERRYQEAMQAAEEVTKSGKKIEVPLEEEKTDAQIAEELKAQGKNVLLNDEGQIVDKRETLSAGLNFVAKPKPAGTVKTQNRAPVQPAWQNKGIGNQKAMRERQTRMIEEQLAAAAKRAADEEAEERRRLEHASKSRKTAAEVGSAKERYLARKKAAEEAKKQQNDAS
ncbi:uncharacterized protein PV09_06523 [Verruconis gallopava]|uniref:Nuclear speckle splicing regulatory protein 1 N-terminal domain-containing protein n=1 Tax=Verruconis gallopava TaxID=253628 RepID=A0A0D2A5N8_9PEZI|nr:uncharacterized protein PV09_06523 [Verruconis gallopava]KIW02018.1 hypothetical protein PV09_06523 [Verruconis gallopava]